MSTLRQPIRWMRENIFVTRDGLAYAIWNLDGRPYGLATHKMKEKVRAQHQALFQNLIGEWTIFAPVATTDPEEIMNKMLRGVENPSQQWLEECQRTYEDLLEYPAGERVYFLIAPLGRGNPKEWMAKLGRSFELSLREKLHLPSWPADEPVFETWKNQMVGVEKKIPTSFKSRRVGISAIRWITHHLTTRGAETTAAYKFDEIKSENATWVNTTCLPEPITHEGALDELAGDKLARTKLYKRRFVKIQTQDSAPSYQCLAAVGLTPQNGFTFPGGEFINAAAMIDRDIDFTIRATVRPAAEVQAQNRKAERTLKDQYKQRAGSDDEITDSGGELDKSAVALKRYTQRLNSSDREVEVAATMIFSSSGATPEEAEDDMKYLRDLYGTDDWTLDVPLGGQEKLFWDTWPGSTVSGICNEFVQVTTGSEFSMGIPLTSDQLGTRDGFRIGVNITTGRFTTVFLNPGEMSVKDLSGSYAAVGELGSGKSVFQKTVASHVIDRGGQLVAVDHSDNQEWAALGRAKTTANVIDFMAPTWSLDPLKLYGPSPRGIRETLDLMNMLLDVSATSKPGVLLNNVLKRIGNKEIEIANLQQLKQHLESNSIEQRNRDVAQDIAGLMDIFSDLDYGAAFFDNSLEPMDFSAQATIFCTHGMTLPSENELFNESARAQMGIDKRVGRAAYAYLARIGTNVMYEDDSQEVLFNVDETHHMTGSPEGEETIKTAIKTGRKHKAAVGLGTHSADELGSEDLRALIPQRVIFRTRDTDLAGKNLRWLDPTYDTDEYRELVTRDLSPTDADDNVPDERRGECLFRDHRNRIGKMKVLIPRSDEAATTVLSTPEAKEDTHGQDEEAA